MQQLAIRFVVAMIAFALGVSAYATWSLYSLPPKLDEQVLPVSELRKDRLHRVYEASLQARGESLNWGAEIASAWLECAQIDGIVDARRSRFAGLDATGCETRDGVVYERNSRLAIYGPMFYQIQKDHKAWLSKNSEFLSQIDTATKADRYVRDNLFEVIADGAWKRDLLDPRHRANLTALSQVVFEIQNEAQDELTTQLGELP